MRPEPIDVQWHHDDKRGGHLGILGQDGLPFPVLRVFWIELAVAPRGRHAHRRQEQLLVMMRGRCVLRASWWEGGVLRTSSHRLLPGSAWHIRPGTWIEIERFSADALLLVLASDRYDEADYIRDRDAWCMEYARP